MPPGAPAIAVMRSLLLQKVLIRGRCFQQWQQSPVYQTRLEKHQLSPHRTDQVTVMSLSDRSSENTVFLPLTTNAPIRCFAFSAFFSPGWWEVRQDQPEWDRLMPPGEMFLRSNPGRRLTFTFLLCQRNFVNVKVWWTLVEEFCSASLLTRFPHDELAPFQGHIFLHSMHVVRSARLRLNFPAAEPSVLSLRLTGFIQFDTCDKLRGFKGFQKALFCHLVNRAFLQNDFSCSESMAAVKSLS